MHIRPVFGLSPVSSKITEIALKENSYTLLAEINFFKSKIALINLKLTKTQEFLTQSLKITQKYQLTRLEKKISVEYDHFLDQLPLWQDLQKRNSPLTERLDLISI